MMTARIAITTGTAMNAETITTTIGAAMAVTMVAEAKTILLTITIRDTEVVDTTESLMEESWRSPKQLYQAGTAAAEFLLQPAEAGTNPATWTCTSILANSQKKCQMC